MATEKDLPALLEESIKASNRTTYAIRAFVRFLFIQLSFLTAAYFAWQIGLAFPDEDNCNPLGCQPNGFWYFAVFAIVATGVILSSRAGWHELSLSEVPGAPLKPDTGKSPKSTSQPREISVEAAKKWLRE